jgi:hypothetical protein
MSTRSGNLFVAILAVVLPAVAPLLADELHAEKRYDAYPEWNYFPRGLDSEDRAESDAYLRLIEEGAAVNEAMMAIVRQCDDPCIVSTALSVLKKSAGDKRAVVGELKPLFAERILRSEGDDEIAGYMAMALAAMGEEEDMSVLLPMLAHPCRRLRIIGTRCIGQRGGLAALEALEQARSSDTDALVREEIGKAISAIETRLAAQDTGEEAVP